MLLMRKQTQRGSEHLRDQLSCVQPQNVHGAGSEGSFSKAEIIKLLFPSLFYDFQDGLLSPGALQPLCSAKQVQLPAQKQPFPQLFRALKLLILNSSLLG